MSSNITFVNCGFYRESDPAFIPLGPLYLISSLKDSGIDVDFRDYQLNSFDNPYDPENFLKFLDQSSDTLGIGCTSDTLPLVLCATRKWKHKKRRLILGGFGPTLAAEEILQNFPHVDVIVLGEGEETFPQLLKSSSPEAIEGIAFSSNGRVQINPPRKRLDLNSISLPAYERIDWKHYKQACLLASRGCPFDCTYCSVSPFWGHRITYRDPEAVAEEMVLLEKKYHQNKIMLCDDAFFTNRAWLMRVLEAFRRKNLRISWSCWGRIDQVDEELLVELKAAGCSLVGYGVESGSDAVLEKIRKNFDVSQVRRAATLTKKYCNVRINFMWGFPFETLRDFQQTCLLHMGFRKEGVASGTFLMAPLPGTELYRQYKDSVYLHPSHCPTFTQPAYDGYKKVGSGPESPLRVIQKHQVISVPFSCYRTDNFSEKMNLAQKFFY